MSISLLRPSLAELFLTNLRLLNLDLKPDCPGITTSLFSSQDVQNQDQRNRIRCTEWALYRLFELWDPAETRNKLQPFFPPLEPLQSLNLRGALYRLLNDLKKQGQLGRETVLRKTMLDDCRGDKFLEVLVIFSTIVLQSIAVPRMLSLEAQQAASVALASASALTSPQHDALLPLTIAHHSSVTALLCKKLEAKQRCLQFADLLDQKLNQLQHRLCSANDTSAPTINASDKERIETEVQQNWLGSSAWPKALVHGENLNSGDQPLKRPFEDIWGIVIEGGAMEPHIVSSGLREDLKQRVEEQQARLQQWRTFHDDLREGSTTARPTCVTGNRDMKANLFSFQEHQSLTLMVTASNSSPTQGSRLVHPKMDSIVSELKAQLVGLVRPSASFVDHGTTTTGQPASQSVADPERPFGSRAHARAASSTFQPRPLTLARGGTAVPLSRVFSPSKAFRANSRSASSTLTDTSSTSSDTTPALGQDQIEPTPPPTPKVVLPNQDAEVHPQISPTELENGSTSAHFNEHTDEHVQSNINVLAPIADMNRLSLADRTRLSILQASSGINSGAPFISNFDDGQLDSPPKATEYMADHQRGLLERTQQSMFNTNMKPSRPRQSNSIQKSRQSITYPVNQFETPGRPRPKPRRDATPTERLFAEDAEYASVFRSRPRIAASPNTSPGDDELPDATYEENEDDSDPVIDGDSWIRSSPLHGRG